jgi:hypothetical protein
VLNTTIGSVSVKTDGTNLEIKRNDRPGSEIYLDAKGVDELLDFLTTLTGDPTNKRRSFRVPLDSNTKLKVSIRIGLDQVRAKPLNISLTGIFIEPDHWLTLDINDPVMVDLQYGELRCTCRATVRRCESNGYGLFFNESIHNGEVAPSPQLLRIVNDLQRIWLANRSNSLI